MVRPILPACALAVALVVGAACSGDGATRGDAPTTTETAATVAAPASTTTGTTPDTTAPIMEGVVAGDVGDDYYPTLGNVGIDVVHYDLDLDYEPGSGSVVGSARLDTVAEVDLAGFDLDLSGLEVTGVSIDGLDAEFTQDAAELQIVLPAPVAAGTELVVEVAYRGELGASPSDSQGFEIGWIVEPWGSYVAAEPDGAHRWFPADDHPSDKATFSVAVTVPAAFDVVAAGREVGRDPVDGDRVRWSFEATDPMAPYLMSVAVGDFDLVEEERADGVLIRHAIPPDVEPGEALALTGEMIDVVAELFGPFPLRTYGVVVVPTELGYALENQTLTLIGTDFLAFPELAEEVLLHEVAHQWAGDAVSPQRWSDIWLNEGLATYAQWWWTERRGGKSAAAQAATAYESAAMIGLDAPLDPGVSDLFDTTVYLRGALVLDALRSDVGDELFVEILHTWFARHAGGSASTDDFLALVDELAGPASAAALDPWLTSDELPDR